MNKIWGRDGAYEVLGTRTHMAALAMADVVSLSSSSLFAFAPVLPHQEGAEPGHGKCQHPPPNVPVEVRTKLSWLCYGNKHIQGLALGFRIWQAAVSALA